MPDSDEKVYDAAATTALMQAARTGKSVLFDGLRGSGTAMPCGCFYYDEGLTLVRCRDHWDRKVVSIGPKERRVVTVKPGTRERPPVVKLEE